MTVTIYSNNTVRADHDTRNLGVIRNSNGFMTFHVAFDNDWPAPAETLEKIAHLDGRRVWGQYPTTALKADIEAALA